MVNVTNQRREGPRCGVARFIVPAPACHVPSSPITNIR